MQSNSFYTCFYICVKCDRFGILCGEKINWEHKMFRIPESFELNRDKGDVSKQFWMLCNADHRDLLKSFDIGRITKTWKHKWTG